MYHTEAEQDILELSLNVGSRNIKIRNGEGKRKLRISLEMKKKSLNGCLDTREGEENRVPEQRKRKGLGTGLSLVSLWGTVLGLS